MAHLPIVYDGVEEPVVDLVVVPGLPDLISQYKLKDHSTWLRDILSHQVRRARIMCYQYDFDQSSSNFTWTFLADLFSNLLFALVHRRREHHEMNRPIVFICCGLGALIFKKAFFEANRNSGFEELFDNTKGLIFLGALHNENGKGFQDSWLRCAAVELGATTRKHASVELLRKSSNWNIVMEITEDFRAMSVTFPVRSFFELSETVYQTGFMAKKSAYLCPEHLASLGWPKERATGVWLSHNLLSTFPTRSDPFFDIFIETVANMVTDCSPLLKVERGVSDLTIHQESNPRASTELLRSLPQNTPGKPKLPCCVTTPHQANPDFVGREDLLTQMHTILQQHSEEPPSQKVYVICGLGGMGKTQVALKYVFEHKNDFSAILWAHADSEAKLAESFSRFAVELGLRPNISADQNSDKEVLKDWLEKTSASWLIVFDNADGKDRDALLKDYWPRTDRGSILITSRDRSLVSQFAGTELPGLDNVSAVDLLLSLTKFNSAQQSKDTLSREKATAELVVKRLGFLPLGILQAANSIVSDGCSLQTFIDAYENKELIKDSEKAPLVRRDSQAYAHSLQTVWNMNFEPLNQEQQTLMNVMAFLDPDRVQTGLFSNGHSNPQDPRMHFISTLSKLHKCKTALVRSSLVTQNEELRELSMHRLVQASCHLRMKKEQRQQNFGIAVSLVRKAWPIPPRNALYDPSLWPKQQALLPHVQSLCRYYVESCVEDEPLIAPDDVNWEFAKLLYEGGWFCYERGLIDSVAALLEPAKNFCLQRLDKDHQERDVLLADIYGGLGALCTEINSFQGAFDNFTKEWEYLRKAFDSGELRRPSIYEVFGLGRLAIGLLGLHRYAEAEVYSRRCLKAFEEVPGDQKIYTTHLATGLLLQGKLEEAESTVKRVIKDRNDRSNFRTGLALFALGNIEIAQAEAYTRDHAKDKAAQKWDNAYDTHTQALQLFDVTLGPVHHRTADAYYKMGWHMHRRRDYPSVMNMLTKAMSIYENHKVFFKNEIARTTYKIGCLLQDMGELAQGRAQIECAEQMRQSLTAPEDWAPVTSEVVYDDLVMFWTR